MTEALVMNPIVRTIGWALMHSLWQGAVIGVATAFALIALRRSPAHLRYITACLGLFAMVAVPVATAERPARDLRATTVRADAVVSGPIDSTASQPDSGTAMFLPPSGMAAAQSWARERLDDWALLAVPLWLAGVLVLSGRLVAGWISVERIRRTEVQLVSAEWRARAQTVADRLRVTRPVVLLESAIVSTPMVIGWLRPVILIPASALTGLTPLQLEAVIAHELAHIRRNDYLLNLAQSTVETLVFYHPATWWLSHRIRVEREYCCDDVAVEVCANRLMYARALADLEQLRSSEHGLAVAATHGSVVHRIRRLLGVSATATNHWSTWMVVCGLLIVLSFMVMREDLNGAQTVAGGAVQGRVVDARTAQPLTSATVHISQRGPVATVSTDLNGRYDARGLEPGEYQVLVQAAGYVPGEYGQRQPADDGIPIVVHDGQATAGVDVRLHQAGIMSGRVFDDTGKGLSGVEVELLTKRSRFGSSLPVAVAFAQTDGSGAFRVGELEEGEYYVRAHVPTSIRPSRAAATNVYVPTYFTDVTHLEDAAPIMVGSGQERYDINFALAAATPHLVSGRLVDQAGPPLDRARVIMIARGGSRGPLVATVSASGAFQMLNVVPGSYMVRVEDPVEPLRWMGAIQQITVNNDVSGVELVARRGGRVAGRIVRDGVDSLPFDPSVIEMGFEIRVEGPRGSGDLVTESKRKVVQGDGTFSIESPGRPAILKVAQLPEGWTVRGIRLGGADITDQATDFGESVVRHVDVLVTNRISDVIGTVTDSNGRVMVNHTVVVFPDDANRWKPPSRFVRATRPRQDGWFQIDDLPPTDYFAISVESLPRNAWTDPLVLDRLVPFATRFRLNEGERRTLQLKLSAVTASTLN